MGTTQRVNSFKLIMGLMDKHVVKLSAGNGCEHVAAITDDGDMYTFGYNARGQLGLGTTSACAFPTRVDAIVVVKVASSYFHTLVATEDNEVYGCGRNDFGQLGIPDGLDKHVLHRVPFFSGRRVLAMACGQYHSLLVSHLTAFTIVDVACGCYHTLTLSDAGRVYPFGRNNHGQLGTNTNLDRLLPICIESLGHVRVLKIAAGFYHSVCITGTSSFGPTRGAAAAAPSLGRDLASLVNNPVRSDVRFVVDGRVVYAHRCILMARCEPLEIMLDGPMRESLQAEIDLPHLSVQTNMRYRPDDYADEHGCVCVPCSMLYSSRCSTIFTPTLSPSWSTKGRTTSVGWLPSTRLDID
ncbi:hypothetical protein DYB35_005557 [Aphanomyces astaci]|uniref:BTB domain-containing protein n=1 Tax=Aphanomyces astaci TaxID=112090 RepID=A0A3R6WQT4_APHAT|nr:hypothetical protein DYB35_005557 [Aphanomyces astaci]